MSRRGLSQLLVTSCAGVVLASIALSVASWAQSAADLERARKAYEEHLRRMEEAERAPRAPAAPAPAAPKAAAPAAPPPAAPQAATPAAAPPAAPKAAAPAAPPPAAPQAATPAAAPKAATPAATVSAAEQDAATERGLEQYRRMMKEDPWSNPAFLDADRGEEAWKRKRGPENKSLAEVCDLGLGVGKVEGAFAELPRYFADADRVMDTETRVLWCLQKFLGFNANDFLANPHPGGGAPVREVGAIATFIASKSEKLKFNSGRTHPKEQEAIALGKAIFHRRQGPFDFACASCHAESGKRIRLQPLPVLANPKEAAVMGEWPAYRVSSTHVMTMQHRLFDCYWQMRLHRLELGSEASNALTAYLHDIARGQNIVAPGLKR